MTAKERQELGEFKEWMEFRVSHHKKNNKIEYYYEAEKILEQFNKLFP